MKKVLALLLAVSILCLSGCGGVVYHASIKEVESNIYTFAEIDDAVDVVMHYFRRNFNGCTLNQLQYAGDEKKEEMDAWAAQYGADEAIILISSFDVDASGGDGSLNPNSTYNGWKWILVRSEGGKWNHADHGYG